MADLLKEIEAQIAAAEAQLKDKDPNSEEGKALTATVKQLQEKRATAQVRNISNNFPALKTRSMSLRK